MAHSDKTLKKSVDKSSKRRTQQGKSPGTRDTVHNDNTLIPERTGYLEMRDQKHNWKVVFCVLIGGSFYWYKCSTEPEPLGVVHLKANSIVVEVALANEKKPHHFGLIKNGESEPLFVGAYSGAKELSSWRKDIEAAAQLDSQGAPAASARIRKMNTTERAKRSAASKAANSVLRKRFLKVVVTDETRQTLDALKSLVKADNAKKAEELDKAIVKVSVTAYILIDSGILRAADFLGADKTLRGAFELLVKVYSYARKKTQKDGRDQEKIINSAFERIESLLKATEKSLSDLISPHLKEKHRTLLPFIFKEVGNKQFFQKILQEAISTQSPPSPERQKHIQTLVEAMEYYTQFHYHM